MRLQLESRPQSLTLVRGALTGLGEALAFDPELLDDLKTAVSEACNNAVLHAYGDGSGPLSVTIKVLDDGVEATIQDRGSGIHAVSLNADRMGVGLAVISALADRAEFSSAPGQGTEVRMVFNGHVKLPPGSRGSNGSKPTASLSGDVVVSLSGVELVGNVLGRLVRGMAATARFSVDRFSDLFLLADTLARHAHIASTDGHIAFALSSATRRLQLDIGPFVDGSSARLESEAPALGQLADEVSIETVDGSELLRLVVCDKGSRSNGPLRHGDEKPSTDR